MKDITGYKPSPATGKLTMKAFTNVLMPKVRAGKWTVAACSRQVVRDLFGLTDEMIDILEKHQEESMNCKKGKGKGGKKK